MANKSTAAYLDEIKTYVGMIFTASQVDLPLLNMLGGLNNNAFSIVDNVEFPQGVLYSHETAAQTTKTEHETLSAPTALSFERSNQVDVIELKLQMAHVTALRESISGRIQTPTSRSLPVEVSEIDWQVQKHIEQVAREYNWAILQGTYAAWADKSTATQQRGLIEQASDASNTVAAGSIDLSSDLIDELVRTMAGNGSIFRMPVFIVNIFQLQRLNTIYGLAERSFTIGGINLDSILVPGVGQVGIVFDKMQPAATLTLAEMSVMQPVALPYRGDIVHVDSRDPGGVGEKEIIYAQIGCDKGPNWMHGTITGLTTS